MNQTFHEWHDDHGCSTEELWKIQNCLGSVLGWEHTLAVEAAEAWHKSMYPEDLQ